MARTWLLLILSGLVSGQGSPVMIMTYNLWNYTQNSGREAAFRTVIQTLEPAVIVAQEVQGSSGYDGFLNAVLETLQPGLWSGAPFTDQSTSLDIALYYQTQLFNFVSTAPINTGQTGGARDAVEFILEHIPSEVRFRIYGVHLKAGNDSGDAATRQTEATLLRNYLDDLPAGSHFLVCGDFNIYSHQSSVEPAFQILTGSGGDPDGQLFDPLNRIGHWHNNYAFREVHTQSSKGGSYGGLDDRFDWIFVSAAVTNQTHDLTYLPDTYWAVGNDGLHFNLAVNADPPNTSVSQNVADALEQASDHLPVVAEFQFPLPEPSPYRLIITEVLPNPSRVSDSFGEWFEVFNPGSLTVDLTGWIVSDSQDDYYRIPTGPEALEIPPGEYRVLGRSADPDLNGGYQALAVLYNFQLGNTSDEIILLDSLQRRVDEVRYTSAFPFGNGVSMYRRHPDYDPNADTSWAASTTPFGMGDYGTPGRAWDDTLSASMNQSPLPLGVRLEPNFPNPFNTLTGITFMLDRAGSLTLAVYDIRGRRVSTLVTGYRPAGQYQVYWEAGPHPSGLYILRLQAGRITRTLKMILLK